MTGTSSSERAERLAADFEAVNARIAAAIEGCTDEQWRRPTAAEGWPVGVVAHHVAEVQRFLGGALAAAGRGAAPATLTSAFIEENNARHARSAAGVGKDETLALIRSTGADATRALRGLDDARLDAVVVEIDGQGMTAAQAVEFGMVGHFAEHLASIQAALTA